MSRKIIDNVNVENREFIYCDTRNCPHKHCLRRITNAPFDELVKVVRSEIDKNGTCKGLMEELR